MFRNSSGQWIASDPPRCNESYRPASEGSPSNPHILPYVIYAPASIASNVVGVESISLVTPNTAASDF